MIKNIKALCLLFTLLWMYSTSFAQVSNWNGKATFSYCYNYDFDINRQTGETIHKSCSFLIDIVADGTGRFIFLDAENGDKFVYSIEEADYGNYKDGSRYLKMLCKNDYGISTVYVSLKNRRDKESITKLAILKPKTNAGTVFSD